MVVNRSWEEIRVAAVRLVANWRDAEGYERGQAQEFVRELFECFGIPSARIIAFEHRVSKLEGGRGFVDAFIPGLVIVEMKSRGKDLDVAEGQAFEYIESLPDKALPRYLLVSDFGRLRVVNAATGARIDEFLLEDFPQHVESLGFLAGYAQTDYTFEEQEQASVQAARLMASLYESLDTSGYAEEHASRFMVRLLYCVYADDAGLFLPHGIFERFVLDHTRDDGSDLGPALSMLFQVLDTPAEKRQKSLPESLRVFPYVNGGVFAEALPMPAISKEGRDRLLECCRFEWSKISPAIFGSLFQAVKSKEARRQLGEHYTTERNIMRVINPLFLDELRDRFAASIDSVGKLRNMLKDLASLRFLDPACGCGNFLVIAFREMRELELEILKRLQELDPKRAQMSLDADSLVGVRLEHFAGIELEEWPATIAATALHLVDHQANAKMEKVLGLTPPSLPLTHAGNIVHDNALRADWGTLFKPSSEVIIMGNPPFAGHKERTPSQGDDLRLVWRTNAIGHLDYVTGWYAKALDYYGDVSGRWAFVSTNSVSFGDSVPALFAPIFDAGWRIRFGHRTFMWTSEAPDAAEVHCVILGFDRSTSPVPALFDYPVLKGEPVLRSAKNINAYLIDGPNVLIRPSRKVLSPALTEIKAGSTPIDWGYLTVEKDEVEAFRADPIASKYLRLYQGGWELINGLERWCLWLENAPPGDIQASPLLRQRVELVRDARTNETVKRAATRALGSTPHLFGERRQPPGNYLGMPQAFARKRKYATAARLGQETIASIKLFTAADDDGLLFAVVSSSMFMAWQSGIGPRTPNNQYSFTASIVWNNLPLPTLDGATRQRIIEAGHGVLAAREVHPERTLDEHYNPLAMDPALIKAHNVLDAVVDRAFGAKRSCADNLQRQSILFERYADLTAGLVPKETVLRNRKRSVPV